MSLRCAILIPARLGSTRMPEKMLRADTGRALITHTLDAAEAARQADPETIAEVIVATDNERIADAVDRYAQSQSLSARAQLTRADHPSGTDRIAEVAASLPAKINTLINIQGDEPDLPAEAILTAARLLADHPQASMSTLVRPLTRRADFENPNNVKAVLDHEGFCLTFSRAAIPFDRDGALQDGDRFGYLHLGIYGYRREMLLGYGRLPESRLEELEKLEQLRALEAGHRIVAAVTDYDGTGIDTEDDYQAFRQRLTSGGGA